MISLGKLCCKLTWPNMTSMGQPAVKHAKLNPSTGKGVWFTTAELNWCMVTGACFDHWFSPPPQRGHWHRGKLHREAVRGPMSVATWAECLDGYAPTIPPKSVTIQQEVPQMKDDESLQYSTKWPMLLWNRSMCGSSFVEKYQYFIIYASLLPFNLANNLVTSRSSSASGMTFFTTWYTCHTFGWGMIHSSPQRKRNIWCLPPMQAGRTKIQKQQHGCKEVESWP